MSKIKNIVSASEVNGYTDILKDKSPVEKSPLDIISEETEAEVNKITRISE